jgi:hypothetical protein
VMGLLRNPDAVRIRKHCQGSRTQKKENYRKLIRG